jgi:formylmethanofuran dehydrogenase subunit E
MRKAKKYSVACEFCGKRFYIPHRPEKNTGYLCRTCTEGFSAEV